MIQSASQLNLISEQCYNEGMKMIQNKLKQDIGATFLRSFAIMRLVATRWLEKNNLSKAE